MTQIVIGEFMCAMCNYGKEYVGYYKLSELVREEPGPLDTGTTCPACGEDVSSSMLEGRCEYCMSELRAILHMKIRRMEAIDYIRRLAATCIIVSEDESWILEQAAMIIKERDVYKGVK